MNGFVQRIQICLWLCGSLLYVVFFGQIFGSDAVYNSDFAAFYCGGDVVRSGADPYRVEPLRSCEQRVSPLFRRGGSLVLPDPVPPYVFPVFMMLSLLPFGTAGVFWSLLIAACFAGCVCLGRRIWKVSDALTYFAISLGGVALYLGQTPPFTALGMVCFSQAIRRASIAWTVGSCVCLMFEPHLAFVIVGAAIIIGEIRVRITAIVTILCGVVSSYFWFGKTLWSEYLFSVLPLHLSSELVNEQQFGLGPIFYQVGLPSSFAISVANAIFWCSCIVVFVFAYRYRKSEPLVVICGAVAVTTACAPFSHITQVGLMSVCACALYSAQKVRIARYAGVFLSVPWLDVSRVLTVMSIAFVGFFRLLRQMRFGIFMVFVVCTCIFSLEYVAYIHILSRLHLGAFHVVADPSMFAEVVWSAFMVHTGARDQMVYALARFPSIVGMWLCVGGFMQVALRRSQILRLEGIREAV